MAVLVQKSFITTCPGDLLEYINNDGTITTELLQIIVVEGGSPQVADFWFDSALSGPETTRLDEILYTEGSPEGWVCPTLPINQVDEQEFTDEDGPDSNTIWSSDKVSNLYQVTNIGGGDGIFAQRSGDGSGSPGNITFEFKSLLVGNELSLVSDSNTLSLSVPLLNGSGSPLPSSGDALTWNGANWVPDTPPLGFGIYAYAKTSGAGALLSSNGLTVNYVSTGVYDYTFTQPYVSSNYAVVGNPVLTVTDTNIQVSNETSTGFRITIGQGDNGGTADVPTDELHSVVVFGVDGPTGLGSAYLSWLAVGNTGTEADFIEDIRSVLIVQDNDVSVGSIYELNFDGTGFSIVTEGSPATKASVSIDESGINHDNLSGFISNEHINHTSVTLTAGSGLSGGGDISASRTFNVNVQNSIEITSDTLQLVNDSASPGNDKLYGTNGSGVKGWYDQPSGGGTPGGDNHDVQFNNSGSFDGSSNFEYDDTLQKVSIMGIPETTALEIGSTGGSPDPSGNATLYIEVNTPSAEIEGMRTYFNRQSAGINGWILYHYDDNTPNIRIIDEDDDPPYISFRTIGSGTFDSPEFESAFGARGAVANRTTGFSWYIGNVSNGGTEIMSLDTSFLNLNSGQYQMNGIPIPLKTYYFFADQVDYPRGSNWSVNNGAPASADTLNSALKVRRFDDTTVEAIGFMVTVPVQAQEMIVRTKARAQTAPGGTQNAIMQLRKRSIDDNTSISSWSTNALTTVALPTNTNFQYDTTSATLGTWGLTAGVTYQMQLVRNASSGSDTLTGDLALLVVEVEFR